ncbi:MAG: CopG family transcriptional regulator [Actinomycetota bacterium]|nr:CopG family transcriptional regulator [Actinomycetota bacterium]
MAVSKKQFNVDLSVTLIDRVRHASVDSNESLSKVVERALENYLTRPKQSSCG